MPRTSKRQDPAQQLPDQTLIIDNGAYNIKAGIAHTDSEITSECHLIPNCIARGLDGPRSTKIYIADQLESCKDFAEMTFRRPVEKGFIVNWDGQLDIWKQGIFNIDSKIKARSLASCNPTETNLILTEAPNCPSTLQQNSDQIAFEELQFPAIYRCLGPSLNLHNDLSSLSHRTTSEKPECTLIVDSGYSHTTVTPLLRGQPLHGAIRRLDIGGKLLTNRMKELISLRQFNLMDDTHLVNQIKEDTCFVSQGFRADVQRSWRPSGKRTTRLSSLSNGQPTVVDYVLPNYHSTFRGHVRAHEAKPSVARFSQKLPSGEQAASEDTCVLGNERFVIPELLFNPGDIGLAQAGLPETVIQSLAAVPAGIWAAMLANVLIVGGNAKIPGFVSRFEAELRTLVPCECPVHVACPEDPVSFTWEGGTRLASDALKLRANLVTKEDYHEHGPEWTRKQFLKLSA